MRRMFKVEEIMHLSWDGRYLIDLKNDRGEGKTTSSIAKKKSKKKVEK
jgi:hypothetical protein